MMSQIVRYIPPVIAALLITAFYLSLPPLKDCPLPEAKAGGGLRFDALALSLICLVYAAVAFWGLGDTKAPQTWHDFDGDEDALIEVSGEGSISRLMLYTNIDTGSYTVNLSSDGVEYEDALSLEQGTDGILKWTELTVDAPNIKYVKIVGNGSPRLGEVGAFGADGVQLILTAQNDAAMELVDEQNLVPEASSYMNSSYFDEIYHARTAYEHLQGMYPYELSHPPLGKLLLSVGIALFGMTPFGWRFMGTLIGVLMLPVMYVFLKKLFGGRTVPVCGTILMAADFMHFTQTRLATIDSYAVFFILLMYLFMYLFISREKLRYLALSGIFFGLGAASKWTCIYAGGGLAVIWAIYWVRQRGRKSFADFAKNCLFCIVFFVLIPCCIYYASYIPYGQARGLDGIGMLFTKDYAKIVVDNQKFMFNYHIGVEATHPYSSRWYQWILDIRPILYYLNYFDDGMRSSFGAWVNPLLCWGGLLALFFLGYMYVFRRDRKAGFILIGYLAQLLPWLLVKRIVFEYHYFPCSVFLVLAMGYMFTLMRDGCKRWKLYVYGFTGLNAAAFVLFYPALTGLRVNNAAATRLLGWLPTWPF